MKILVFLNELGLGGTEKAAARWAQGLAERGHALHVLTLMDGPRRADFERHGIEVRIVSPGAEVIRDQVRSLRPDVIHVHAPGHPHVGDVLGQALESLPKIPVLQTNVFGQLLNPKEDAWTDFRLFVSWTSCVQAARRNFRRLDTEFFRLNSVAVCPLDPEEAPSKAETEMFRARHGVRRDEVLFGRLSRPEPNKWTDLPLQAFRRAFLRNSAMKLLLREPPLPVRQEIERSDDRDRFVILPVTSDLQELKLTIASLDVVLHTSSIGESFGYGIAEPMNFGKPVIANSTPWGDQAQLELVRDEECGLIASTPVTLAEAICRLAADEELRKSFGTRGREHIRKLSDPKASLDRLEETTAATAEKKPNPRIEEDLSNARAAAANLDEQQFGHTLGEQLILRSHYYRARFYQARRRWKPRAATKR